MIKKQFPTAYDIEQTITFRTASYIGFKRFTQSLGILNLGEGKKALADFVLGGVFFEHQDYVAMRRLAQGAEAATSISGFTIRDRLWPVKDMDELLDDIVALRDQLIGQESTLIKKGAPLQKLAMPEVKNGIIVLHFEYQRMIPGRIELMQQIDTEVGFVIEPVGQGQWRVVCYPQANQDVKTVEVLFKKLADGAFEPFAISLERFTQQQRIEFFDSLIDRYRSHDEWRVEQVTEITLRQPSSSEKDLFIVDEESDESLEFLGDDELQEASQDDLLSITQAVLQGKHLRTNSFVQKCEQLGFYFLSMTLELSNRKTSELIQVTVRFKLSPKMFEVVLAAMAERTEMGDSSVAFSGNRQQEILKEFWDASHEIWQRINENLPSKDLQYALPNVTSHKQD